MLIHNPAEAFKAWRSFSGLGVGKGVCGAVRARALGRLWKSTYIAVCTENSGTNSTQQIPIPRSTDLERAGPAPRWVRLGVLPEPEGAWATLRSVLCLSHGSCYMQALRLALPESFPSGRERWGHHMMLTPASQRGLPGARLCWEWFT